MRVPDHPERAVPLNAIIIGTGFGGLGMAMALKRQGHDDFVILEKAGDVGGVWRDNHYPGAACDVPSHLYSFSFEPSARWSRVFAPQAEIHEYLRHCADKYQLRAHTHFNTEVAQARFDEQTDLWTVTSSTGQSWRARMLISAVGQLSLPALPNLPGLDDFKGRCFHSARWDHDYPLDGKRVAVIGTGASALQFVPAIAGQVKQLKVFQRSPAYIIPKSDRPYTPFESALFKRMPTAMKAYRAAIYIKYESRAIALRYFKGLLKVAIGWPFEKMLKHQVPDEDLQLKLTPHYQIGCKRILLSDDYLATLARPNVQLVSEAIQRITADGIDTQDGQHHAVDAIIYGTGFAATRFLAPMRITGRQGLELNNVWQQGAQAYLGMTVPGFPNFFMLYGPNTNLGHNSIVYMLESQIEHIMRCLSTMKRQGALAIEVDAGRYRRFNAGIHEHLAHTVWNGCSSWYLDAQGRNSTNWPGFTLTYRWLTRHAALDAYRLSSPAQALGKPPLAHLQVNTMASPAGLLEALQATLLRGFVRLAFRPLIGPPFSAATQRRVVNALSWLMPDARGTMHRVIDANGVPTEVVQARSSRHGGSGPAVLYLHGGAFCLGSPATHRSLTTHLALSADMPVWVPDYRLAPEHPYPAALDDALACYRAMLTQGHAAQDIVIAGDSAGGSLTLALALRLRDMGAPMPAALILLSPVTDPSLSGSTLQTHAARDPMLRQGWLAQALRWYQCPATALEHHPLAHQLKGLPPMLIQVGDEEILLADSLRLAEQAARNSVPCQLEIHAERWHVFHLQAFYLASARNALASAARFANKHVASQSLKDGSIRAPRPRSVSNSQG